MLRISQNLQYLSKYVSITYPEIHRACYLSRPLSEAIERDDDGARMSDRCAGPVIRRARSARLLTSDHHHAASVSPPAAPSVPPYSQLPYMTRCLKSARPRDVHAAQQTHHRPPDDRHRPSERGGGTRVREHVSRLNIY
ncbi:hypothetical protein HDZ31DRAFT_47899 [Schizophyllum fasciatum]